MKANSTFYEIKKWIILVLIAVVTFWGVNNFEQVKSLLGSIYNVFFPFVLGGILAFVLNVPMTAIEKRLKKVIKSEKKQKLIRIISITLSCLLLMLIVVIVAFLLIPELVDNIQLLIKNIPALVDKIEGYLLNILEKFPDLQVQIKEAFLKTENTGSLISNALNYFLNGAIGFISSLVSGFVTVFTAIIFSIYMLAQKEYLVRGVKKIIYAITSKPKANRIIEIAALANRTFSKFISGQCVEAVILGTIIFATLLILRFSYALIIGALTAITALIPIFGAIIAMVIGAILIAITNPMQALVFIAIFLVIQQIEGNFIYPKVVGKSVGLSPMWTLLSITVCGNLFGVGGMLIGLPLASVIYAVARSRVNDVLEEKKIVIS